MKYNCEKFDELYKAVQELGSTDIRLISNGFADGHLKGVFFRIFQEADDFEDGKVKSYTAWIGMKDENSKGSLWTALYSGDEVRQWANGR